MKEEEFQHSLKLDLNFGNHTEFQKKFLHNKNRDPSVETISNSNTFRLKNNTSLLKSPANIESVDFININENENLPPIKSERKTKTFASNLAIRNRKKPQGLNLGLLMEQNLEYFGNHYPVIMNNVKRFVTKIKEKNKNFDKGENLDQKDYNIINDASYYNTEQKEKNYFSQFENKFFYCLSYYLIKLKTKIINPIHPYDEFKLFWDFINVLLTIFYFFYMPLSFTFKIELFTLIMKQIIAIILIADMFVQLNTFYFQSGLEVRNRRKMIKNYVKTRFFPDLLALISFLPEFFDLHPALKFFFFIKIYSIAVIHEKFMNRLQLSRKLRGIKSLIVLLLIILLISHLIACIWSFVSNPEFDYNKSHETWIKAKKIVEKEWYITYLYSFYWSIITVMTVGYGDITPQNEIETITAFTSILLGCMVFAYSINKIGSIIQDINTDKYNFDNTLHTINSYMIRKKIRPELRTRIREYLKFVWMDRNALHTDEEERIINSLSHSLKESLSLEAYGRFLTSNPIFVKYFSEETLKKMTFAMKEVTFTPGDEIYMQGTLEKDPALFIILEGKVKLVSQRNRSLVVLKELKKGDYFGELSFFMNSRRENMALCDKFVTLFMIKQSDFLQIINSSSSKIDYESLKYIQDKLTFSNDFSFIEHRCLGCNRFDHLLISCPKFHIIPDKEKIIKEYLFPSIQPHRSSHSRRDQKISSLKNYFLNLRSAKRKDFSLKAYPSQTQSLTHIEHHESMDCIETESILMPESQEITEERKMKACLSLKTEDQNLADKSKENRDERITDSKTFSEKHTYSQKLPLKVRSKSSIFLDENGGQSPSLVSPGSTNKNKIPGAEEETSNDFLWKHFERAHYYEKYFPKNNLEYIIRKWNRTKYIMKKINEKKEGVAETYKDLKNYYFNADFFLEKITIENLLKKKALKRSRSSKREKSLTKCLAVSGNKRTIFSLNCYPKKELKEKPNLIELDVDKGKSNRRATKIFVNPNALNQKEKKSMK